MTVTDPVAYVLAQTKANIEFLQSTSQITAEDARIILEKLSLSTSASTAPRTASLDILSMPIANMSLGSHTPRPERASPVSNFPPPPSRTPVVPTSALSRPPPPIPSSCLFKARAMWGYNENGTEVDDLIFFEGDIIEVLDDKNADWWKGRVRGKQGLFPVSYVQRLPDERPPSNNRVPSYSPMPPPPSNQYAPQYAPAGPYPTHNSYYPPPQGPPPNGPYLSYQAPPPPGPAPVPLQPPSAQLDGKKPGFLQGKLGSTLAQSAVGGVGFGAGSAVGSGIINSIF